MDKKNIALLTQFLFDTMMEIVYKYEGLTSEHLCAKIQLAKSYGYNLEDQNDDTKLGMELIDDCHKMMQHSNNNESIANHLQKTIEYWDKILDNKKRGMDG